MMGVTFANVTEGAQERNSEADNVINDAGLACELLAHLKTLVSAARALRVSGWRLSAGTDDRTVCTITEIRNYEFEE